MKFVCDNCKAKYQIGDDKVAGKTLRMKCRRCGHMIQVAATVTESSVSQKLPTEPAAGSVPAGSGGMGSGLGPLEGPSEDGATIVRPSPNIAAADLTPLVLRSWIDAARLLGDRQ